MVWPEEVKRACSTPRTRSPSSSDVPITVLLLDHKCLLTSFRQTTTLCPYQLNAPPYHLEHPHSFGCPPSPRTLFLSCHCAISPISSRLFWFFLELRETLSIPDNHRSHPSIEMGFVTLGLKILYCPISYAQLLSLKHCLITTYVMSQANKNPRENTPRALA